MKHTLKNLLLMNKSRLEAFSDGVIAIIITIMVLEFKAPEHANLEGLKELAPTFGSYVLSFVLVGVYWNNHHHLLHSLKKMSSAVMWANLNLLFWLSLIPFGTKWLDETTFDRFTIIVYAILAFMCGVSYNILQRQVVKSLAGEHNKLQAIVSSQNNKVLISVMANVLAVPAAFVNTYLALGLCALSAGIWIVPSKELEKELTKTDHK